jgi:hypothetical protein
MTFRSRLGCEWYLLRTCDCADCQSRRLVLKVAGLFVLVCLAILVVLAVNVL